MSDRLHLDLLRLAPPLNADPATRDELHANESVRRLHQLLSLLTAEAREPAPVVSLRAGGRH